MKILHPVIFLLAIFFNSLSQANEPLKVVTSIPPLNAIVAGITYGVSQPVMLVPPGASHHHYVLKPSDRQALQQANVVIWIGEEMENYLIKPIANLSDKTIVISVIDLPDLILLPTRTDDSWQVHVHTDNLQNKAHLDPHVWMNPQNVIYITQTLSEIFAQQDVNNATQYKNNAKNMITKLNELDKEIKLKLAPFKNEQFLVFHDAYQYFEKHYGLNAFGSISANSDLPPSARRIAQLQKMIKENHIQCIFAEIGTNPPLVTTLAKPSSIHIGYLDSMGNGQNFSDYLNLLRYDANAFSTCFAN